MKRMIAVSLVIMPLLASAQSAPRAALAAKAPAYESSFRGYRAFRDEPVGNWRDINAATAKAGGWRIYAREQNASRDESHAESPSSSSKTPASMEHGDMNHGGAK